jgi:hypothetical protein
MHPYFPYLSILLCLMADALLISERVLPVNELSNWLFIAYYYKWYSTDFYNTILYSY